MSELINCINNLSAKEIIKSIAKTANGTPFYLQTTGLGGFLCAEYETVYNGFTTKPDAARSTIYDTMVCALVASGHWTRIDAFYFHAAHTNGASESLINWKNPGTNDATIHGLVPPAFTIDEGFLGDGVNGFINYNWIPATHGVNYVRNSASQILYIRTDVSSALGRHGIDGSADTFDCSIQNRNGVNAFIQMNDTSNEAGGVASGAGMFINTRTAASGAGSKILYQNKLIEVNASVASLGVPTHSFYSLGANNDDVVSGPRADQVSMAAYADGFVQADVDTVSDIINAAMTSLGTNVY